MVIISEKQKYPFSHGIDIKQDFLKKINKLESMESSGEVVAFEQEQKENVPKSKRGKKRKVMEKEKKNKCRQIQISLAALHQVGQPGRLIDLFRGTTEDQTGRD